MSKTLVLIINIAAVLLSACGPQEPKKIYVTEREEQPEPKKDTESAVKPLPVDTTAIQNDELKRQQEEAQKKKDELAKQEEEKKKQEEANKPKEPTTTPTPTATLYTWNKGQGATFSQASTGMGTWDGERMYACRVSGVVAGEALLGTYIPSRGRCFLGYAGEGYYSEVYETLAVTQQGFQVLKYVAGGSTPTLPSGAVKMGSLRDGRPLYICRVKFTNGNSVIGKFVANSGCYYSIDAVEYQATYYEVFVNIK